MEDCPRRLVLPAPLAMLDFYAPRLWRDGLRSREALGLPGRREIARRFLGKCVVRHPTALERPVQGIAPKRVTNHGRDGGRRSRLRIFDPSLRGGAPPDVRRPLAAVVSRPRIGGAGVRPSAFPGECSSRVKRGCRACGSGSIPSECAPWRRNTPHKRSRTAALRVTGRSA